MGPTRRNIKPDTVPLDNNDKTLLHTSKRLDTSVKSGGSFFGEACARSAEASLKYARIQRRRFHTMLRAGAFKECSKLPGLREYSTRHG